MPSIAETIVVERAAIIAAWTREATRAAAARGLTQPEIANIMPEFLASLADLREGGELNPKSRRTLETHVRSRVRHGFRLPEMVEELSLLGRCVVDASQRAGDGPPDPNEIERLFATLHSGSVLVTDLYERQMLDEEQSEKLYLRRIRDLVADSLRRGISIEAQLQGAVELICEAMQSDCAVIAVYDQANRSLFGAATVGVAGERLRELARERDNVFLDGPVAARAPALAEAVVVSDIADVAELREAGVRAVLGVRVSTHVGLLGSIHVGIGAEREVASEELSRLEAFGSWLTLHLDNARLFDELRVQVEQLQQERELRDRFVSILAHDLRGPLSAAKVLAHMLEHHAASEAKRDELAQRMQRSLDRLELMIAELLDANRLHATHRMIVSVKRVALDDLARDVVDDFTRQYGARFVLDADVGIVGYWGREELRRALWNLVDNAVKYGSPGTAITIRLRRSQVGVQLAVHNVGAPIPKHELAQLFRAYARTRASEIAGAKGWGLGLAQVLACAEAHGGKVAVESTAASGTEFRIELPMDARPFQPAAADDVSASIH